MDQSRQSKRNLLWWILVTAAATLLLSAAMPLLVKASPLFAGWIRSYHVWEFSGQGSISYLGPFRPSYRVVWAEIPLHKPGEYRYSFRGLPSEDNMNFSLEMPGRSNVDLLSKEWQQLVNLKTLIEVTLTDSSGRIVCKASATPGGAPFAPGDTQKWVLQGGGEVAYWHRNCLHFPTRYKSSYTLAIRIKDPDPRTPKALRIPKLEGGGMELP